VRCAVGWSVGGYVRCGKGGWGGVGAIGGGEKKCKAVGAPEDPRQGQQFYLCDGRHPCGWFYST
jgi:hypothetical protein